MARSRVARRDRGARRTPCTAGQMLRYLVDNSTRDACSSSASGSSRSSPRSRRDLPQLRPSSFPTADAAPPGLPGRVVDPRELLRRRAAAATDLAGPDYWDVAAIIYTSGTTGPSKGVLMPWGTLWSFVTTAPDDFVAPGRGLLRDVPGVPRLGEGDAVPGGGLPGPHGDPRAVLDPALLGRRAAVRHHRRRACRSDGAVPPACSPSSPTTPTRRCAT